MPGSLDENALDRPAPGELRLRIAPRELGRRRRMGLAALLLLTLFLSGSASFEDGHPWIGVPVMLGAGLAFLVTAVWGGHHHVLRWSDAASGALFLLASGTRFAHGKRLLPTLQLVGGLLLIAMAVLDLQARRGRLLVSAAGLTVRRSRFRRRFFAWHELTSLALEGQVLRLASRAGAVEELVITQPLDEPTRARLRLPPRAEPEGSGALRDPPGAPENPG